VLAVPNPVVGAAATLSVQLAGPADELRWSVYTAAMAKACGGAQAGQLQAGRNNLAMDLSGLPNGLFYAVVSAARSNGEVSERRIVKILILR
jgi:hypothetical protein